MIAFAASLAIWRGHSSEVTEEIDPNLALVVGYRLGAEFLINIRARAR